MTFGINYAFSLFWVIDVGQWWLRGPSWPYRSRIYYAILHGVFAFMVFNGTVVFGPPAWRILFRDEALMDPPRRVIPAAAARSARKG